MKEQLIELANEKGFTPISSEGIGRTFKDVFSELSIYNDLDYYLWMCELQKWLRDEYKYHIITIPTITMDWTYKIITLVGDIEQPPYSGVASTDYSTPEQALEQGLINGLKLIK